MLKEASRQSLLYLRYMYLHCLSFCILSGVYTQDPVWIAVDPTVKPWFLRRGRVTACRVPGAEHVSDEFFDVTSLVPEMLRCELFTPIQGWVSPDPCTFWDPDSSTTQERNTLSTVPPAELQYPINRSCKIPHSRSIACGCPNYHSVFRWCCGPAPAR